MTATATPLGAPVVAASLARAGRALLLAATPAAQLARYTLVGALTSLLQVVVLLALTTHGDVVATVVAAAASTVVANELHRRLTFRAAQEVGFLTGQLEGGGLALVSVGLGALATVVLDALVAEPTAQLRVAVALAATGAVGLAKFGALRGLVFRAA